VAVYVFQRTLLAVMRPLHSLKMEMFLLYVIM